MVDVDKELADSNSDIEEKDIMDMSLKEFILTKQFRSSLFSLALGIIVTFAVIFFFKGKWKMYGSLVGALLVVAPINSLQQFVNTKTVPGYYSMVKQVKEEKASRYKVIKLDETKDEDE